MQSIITLKNFDHSCSFGNQQPIGLIAGMNAIESYELLAQVAEVCKKTASKYGISFVFKVSFDKANRSSIHSYRGVGMEKGLTWLADIKAQFNVPIITDVHDVSQVDAVSQVADILQLPAFLSRQTDLVLALARCGKPINIKKAQFLTPDDMRHVIAKFAECGGQQVMLCERGSCFGYHNLVVDMLAFDIMKSFGVPVIFDVTHALQLPGAGDLAADGRRAAALQLAKAGISQGIAGVFLETHPNPEQAKCDGPCALPLHLLDAFIGQLVAVDRLVKSQPLLAIE